MDVNGTSLFRGQEINVNNSQNNEEEEDLEDQLRRREELQNLLENALDDFKYEDSTINSSTNISTASAPDLQNYCDVTSNDQLKVLYDVRLREINNLRKEFDEYKLGKTKEVDNLKNKLILAEADIKQLKVSLSSAESLLVDKTDTINNLNKVLQSNEEEICKKHRKCEEYEIELTAYKSIINELQLKLQMESNSFGNIEQKFHSGEIQRINKDQILKLEAQVEDANQRSEILENEIKKIKEELQRALLEKKQSETDFDNTKTALIKSFEDAQQQCRDLLDIINVLTKENEHFKDELSSKNILEIENYDLETTKESLVTQCEKLKRMLVDKSMEITSLQTKLKNYNEIIDELLEYRQLKVDFLNKECNGNSDSSKEILLLQNELKHCKSIICDKENQLSNLTRINRELQEKIEEMLLQTRNEIQNLSNKYNLPQLDVMSKDLCRAEERILELEEKLSILEEEKSKNMAKHKLEKAQHQIIQLQKMYKLEKNNFEALIRMIQKDLKKSEQEVEKLKQQNEEFKRNNMSVSESRDQKQEVSDLQEKTKLMTCNLRKIELVRNEIDEFLSKLNANDVEKKFIEKKLDDWRKELDLSETNYDIELTESIDTEKKMNELNILVKELTCAKSEAENIIAELKNQIQEYDQKLANYNVLESKIENLNLELRNRDMMINQASELEIKLKNQEEMLKSVENDKIQLTEALEQMKLELDDAINKIIILEKDLTDNKDKVDGTTPQLVLQETEGNPFVEVEKDISLTKNIQMEVLKEEFKIRDELQNEYTKKLSEIETKYMAICNKNAELYNSQIEKTKNVDQRYREYVARILNDCAQKILQIEKDHEELLDKCSTFKNENNHLKNYIKNLEEQYSVIVKRIEIQAQKSIETWKRWSRNFVERSLNIEQLNRITRNKILDKMPEKDSEIETIEKEFNSYINKYTKKINC